jgi:adenylate cyclase
VDAVASAVDIQRELAGRNAELPPERRMPFRIGINLGDVMVESDRIMGDGVNVAARVEGLAEPGGIGISGTVFDQVEGKLALEFEDLGEQTVKNIPKPVRVYRVLVRSRDAASAVGDEALAGAAELTVPGFSGRPAIAVLPFDNLSGDPEQEYFADGIAEDLITRLSSWRWFPVIARNSSFSYKGKSVDVRQVSRELGVRYVVEGSVRKAGNRVRVSAQLIDATTGHHVWAEHYDRELEDIFDLQDEITETIVVSLEPAMDKVERERALRQDPKNLQAWECYQRGMWHAFQFTKDDNLKARSYFLKASELDPHFSSSFSFLGWSHYLDLQYQWSESPAQSLASYYQEAEKAVSLDDNDAIAHFFLGSACFHMRQYERGIVEAGRGIALNPSYAYSYFIQGLCLAMLGRPDEAIGLLEKAIRLSRHDPLMFFSVLGLGMVHFVADRYEEALACAERSLQLRSDQPQTLRLIAACCGHLGRAEEALEALDKMLKLTPDFSVEALRVYGPPALVEGYLEGWRKAGWKEE